MQSLARHRGAGSFWQPPVAWVRGRPLACVMHSTSGKSVQGLPPGSVNISVRGDHLLLDQPTCKQAWHKQAVPRICTMNACCAAATLKTLGIPVLVGPGSLRQCCSQRMPCCCCRGCSCLSPAQVSHDGCHLLWRAMHLANAAALARHAPLA